MLFNNLKLITTNGAIICYVRPPPSCYTGETETTTIDHQHVFVPERRIDKPETIV